MAFSVIGDRKELLQSLPCLILDLKGIMQQMTAVLERFTDKQIFPGILLSNQEYFRASGVFIYQNMNYDNFTLRVRNVSFKPIFKKYHQLSYYCTPFFSNFIYRQIYGFFDCFVSWIYRLGLCIFSKYTMKSLNCVGSANCRFAN